jgi:hypothetical protein
MLWDEERKRRDIDRETDYAAKVAEVRRLDEIADGRPISDAGTH